MFNSLLEIQKVIQKLDTGVLTALRKRDFVDTVLRAQINTALEYTGPRYSRRHSYRLLKSLLGCASFTRSAQRIARNTGCTAEEAEQELKDIIPFPTTRRRKR
jgi:glycerol-3-phosphate O-acyltransferase